MEIQCFLHFLTCLAFASLLCTQIKIKSISIFNYRRWNDGSSNIHIVSPQVCCWRGRTSKSSIGWGWRIRTESTMSKRENSTLKNSNINTLTALYKLMSINWTHPKHLMCCVKYVKTYDSFAIALEPLCEPFETKSSRKSKINCY